MTIELKPQPGPQTAFLNSPADIAIYGGAAGSGKTYGELLEPLRHVRENGGFSAVIFRRTTPRIKNPGGLWDESMGIYGPAGGIPVANPVMEWKWPKGGRVRFAHLEHETTVLDWHGAQVPLIMFDELTEFTRYQFFYLLSRNRSTCGVRPYVRATCNADADSWVAEFIEWWICQDSRSPIYGFPYPERANKLRWFVRVGEKLVWADSPEGLTHEALSLPLTDKQGRPIELMPKSVSFIPASIYDNRKLLEINPEYLGNLLALPPVERERLLRGNWKIRPAAGLLFKREWCRVVKTAPVDLVYKRGWDLAATAKTQDNDPDYTATTKLGRSQQGRYLVADYMKMWGTPGEVENVIRNVASQDKAKHGECEQWLPQDPGQAGKSQVRYLILALDGYTTRSSLETGDKVTRFGGISAQAQAGNVDVLEGPWNDEFFSDMEAFPDAAHDDGPDSMSRAHNAYQDSHSGMIDFMRQEVARVMKKKEEASKPPPMATMANGGVKMKPKLATNVLYDLRGQPLFPDDDGNFIVSEKHAGFLKKSGWTVLELTDVQN